MNILAIETSMGRTSVALARRGEPVLAKRIASGRAQAEQLIPLIGALMAEAGMPFARLNRVAVSIGPGGFSGIRTGVAAGRGIALAAGIPAVGATSFRIMAAAFEKAGETPDAYGLAAPAGMNAVYCQVLARGQHPLTDILALSKTECAAFFERKNAKVVAGPTAGALSNEGFISLPVAGGALHPDAAVLAEIATGLDPERDAPSPYYVRDADARPQTNHVIALDSDYNKLSPSCVTEAAAADAAHLAALYAEASPPGWPAGELAAACSDPNRAVLKAEDGAVLHGFIILQFPGDEAEILALAVARNRRRLGHAASLLDAALSACRRRLTSCIYLEVAESNTPARRLYEKFGFVVVGRRENYYRLSGSAAETALIMRREAMPLLPVDLEKSCT